MQLTSDPGELGYVYIYVTSKQRCYITSSVRMGIAFSIVAVSLLGGTPIEGVLLGTHGENFAWASPIIFCGVRRTCFQPLQRSLKIVHGQVMITCGSLGMTISRYLYVRSRQISKRDRFV